MADTLGSLLRNGFRNIFRNRDPTFGKQIDNTSSYYNYSYRPDRLDLRPSNERTLAMAMFNRIALDIASIDIRHVILDENGRYQETIHSDLNECLELSANKDQTARAFKQDAILSMFDEGEIAIVAVDTEGTLESDYINPPKGEFEDEDCYRILSIRVGKVLQWMPDYVKVKVYNERSGSKEEVVVKKENVCLIENPLYQVINRPNSMIKRVVRKLALLDAIDEQSSAGKLDLIVQLPYVIKGDARRAQAEDRRKELEKQLAGSKYGIAYTDGTEKITQLNRPIENNLMGQIEYLTSMLYSQFGMTQGILDGTADENTMTNYYSRIIEPILTAIVDEMKRKFLTYTARQNGQSIMFFRDPFKLIPVSKMADIADRYTRNEILTSNEVRQITGLKPSADPNADVLRNKNINQNNAMFFPQQEGEQPIDEQAMEGQEGVEETGMEN